MERRSAGFVARGADAAPVAHDAAEPKSLSPARVSVPVRRVATGFSLLRLSVPARLAIVSVAAAALWGAVLWALV
jgi:hypothetical protein